MVGPVAKCEAVAHLQTVMGLSERRACCIFSAHRKMVRYRPCRPPDTELAANCASLPMAAGGSVIAGCSCCCVSWASHPG